MHILRCMGLKFCVKFQRAPLKFHTKFWIHTQKDMNFTDFHFCVWFTISLKYDVISLMRRAPECIFMCKVFWSITMRSWTIWEMTCSIWQSEAIFSYNCFRYGQVITCQFPDDIFKWIFLNENIWISIEISLKFVLKGPINNIPALVQIMTWRRPVDKPLSEPMMISLLTHICVTRPQWVNWGLAKAV